MKKVLSLILALVMIASCVFALSACKDDKKDDKKDESKEVKEESKLDGEYVYSDFDVKVIVNGEDVTEEMLSSLGEDAFDDSNLKRNYLNIKGNKMTFSGETLEIEFEEKNGKLVINDKDKADVINAMDVNFAEELGLEGDVDIAFNVSGSTITLESSISISNESMTLDVAVYINFKK